MFTRFSIFVILLCLFLAVKPESTQAQSKLDSIATYLASEMQVRNIPGLQVVVIREGKVVYSDAMGLANVEHQIPVTSHTSFSINSATKAFTGVAILQLMEDNRIDIARPIGDYLDSLPPVWARIKVKSLLNHTSGIPDFLDRRNGGYVFGMKYADAWQKIRDLPMEFPEGTATSYNQTNYVLLGQMIEKLSGMSFEAFVRVRQFEPAGMHQASFGDSRDVIVDKAPTYSMARTTGQGRVQGKTLVRTWEEFPELRSTAGINCSAEDLGRWIIALQSHKLLKKQKSLDLMWTAEKLDQGSYGGWTLGWVARRTIAPRAVAGIGGSRSWFYLYPDHDLAVIVLTNMKSIGPENLASEVAGFYYPALKAVNGGNLPESVIPLYQIVERGNYSDAIAVYCRLKAEQPDYFTSARDLMNWAYSVLLLQKNPAKSIPLFQLLLYLYPDSEEGKAGLAEAQKGI